MTVRAMKRPEGGALRQDSRWGRLRRITAPIPSNRVTLAYHRAVDVGPPNFKPTSDAEHRSGETETGEETKGLVTATMSPRMPFWSRLVAFAGRPVVAIVAIAILAAVPRFWALGDPGTDKGGKRVYVFDETYYAKDACLYAGIPFKKCDLTSGSEQSWVHPPLGKWAIAAGIKLFGNTPLGSRIPSAVFGTGTVVIIALIALLLFGSVLWCYVAGILAASEGLLVVQSRVTLLDIFVAFWVVLGFLFVVLDRRYVCRKTQTSDREIPGQPALSMGPGAMARSEPATHPVPAPDTESDPQPEPASRPLRHHVPTPLWRPWRFAAGFAFGAAVATKWNGMPALFGALFLMAAWEVTRRRRPGDVSLWELAARVSLGLVLLADGFAFGGAFAGKWSGVPALAVLLLLVVPGTWLVGHLFKRPVPLGLGGVTMGVVLLAAVFAEGFALGAAVGGEWPGVVWLAGTPVLLLVVASTERNRRRRERRLNPVAEAVRQEGFTMLVAMVLLPLVVYVGSYSGKIDPKTYPQYHPGLGFSFSPSALVDLWHLQGQIAHFHEHLYAYDASKPDHKAHPYQSRPWTWAYLGRPVSYYYETTHTDSPQERRSEILGVGNPAIFWAGYLVVPWLLWTMWKRRSWVVTFILVALLSQYLFWFIPKVSLEKVQFLFYATPIVPFLILGIVYVLRDLSRIRIQDSTSRPFMPVVVGYVVTAVAVFWWLWPVLSAFPLSKGAWQARVWFPSWI
jgi:dolichyl-phosphate-mannose--protein O-mannosyl transferase